MTVSGAYGRDYKSKAAIIADLKAGKDFQLRGLQSGYTNREDMIKAGLTEVTVRYAQDRKVAIVKISEIR